MIYQLARIGWQYLDVTDADGQLAQCPGIGETDRTDGHGAFGAFHGRFRDNADADITFDQAADSVETSQLHAQTQRTADTVSLVSEKTLDRAGAIQPNHVVVQHFGEPDTRAIGERMVLGDHQHETIAAKGKRS